MKLKVDPRTCQGPAGHAKRLQLALNRERPPENGVTNVTDSAPKICWLSEFAFLALRISFSGSQNVLFWLSEFPFLARLRPFLFWDEEKLT